MKKAEETRYMPLLIFIGILMLLLLIRLFVLTVVQEDKWSEAAENNSTKEIYTAAPRGEILDRNGKVLAGNKHTFSVNINRGKADAESLNKQITRLLAIFRKNHDNYYDNFPIKISSEGRFYYTYEKDKRKWQKSENIPLDYTAKEAFAFLRKSYNIGSDLTDTEAQKELQQKYNKYPEISVARMEYTADVEKDAFMDRYELDRGTSAKDAFQQIRDLMKIDKKLGDRKAREIMVVRNELQSMGYMTYMPVTVAQNVSKMTIIQIEEESEDFTNVEVATETRRYYPGGKTAAHILGYMGAISESEKDKYIKKGYQSTDLIGRNGVEASYEKVLHGKDGVKKVQVDSGGNVTDTISQKDPVKGKDLYLTIDLDLQKDLEDALKRGIKCTRKGGTFKSKYGSFPYSRHYSHCKSGAAVAIDVKTGDVLAMASYPAYDPNRFSTGISAEDWEDVQSDNPNDPLSPAPLYNIASMSAVQPGSTFKPVTATAALYCGLDPARHLTDAGAIKLGDMSFGCWLYNEGNGKASHGSIDLPTAIEVSCNYYFADVGTGKDWATGASLGYKRKMDINRIMKFARQYGLGSKTGIEIPESIARIPSAENKMNTAKAQLKNVLLANAEEYFTEKTTEDRKLLDSEIDEIAGWIKEDPSRDELIERIGKLHVKKKKVEPLADLCKYTYFVEAKLGTGDMFNISIGQGSNAYTPLQMANYLATIGNNGKHNKVSVIRKVEGGKIKKKPEATKVTISKKGLKAIREGLYRVCNGGQGSVASVFSGFDIPCAGKTGTAERAGRINTTDEVKYVREHLGSIAPGLKWKKVRKEMKRIMKKYPDIYTSEQTAVRRAVMNLSKATADSIDKFKPEYDNFAWLICMAPADDPEIAVAVLLVQGGESLYAGPIAKEIIGDYFHKDKKKTKKTSN
ncbi:MAG: hypothetical protein IJF96_06075 [Firmicutes bacterium]|nr:hypothetical protein [Bacillota bacterium]